MATIGSVPAQLNVRNPVQGAASSQAAGLAGLSEALGGLSSAYAGRAESLLNTTESDTTRELRLRDRQENIERARFMVEFSRMQGEWAREATDIETNAAADGSDLEPSLRTGLERRLKTFESKLPEHLKNTFLPQLENYRQNETSGAFAKRLQMEGKQYLTDAQDLQTRVLDDLFQGRTDITTANKLIDEYVKHSPLPKAESEVLSRSLKKQAQELDFLANAKAEFIAPEYSQGRTASGAPVALPASADAFLNAVSGVESGGDYGVMYSPGPEKRRFTDFSKHPNQPAVIASGPHAGETSTAAGRFQYIKSTWDFVAGAIGAEDFSPANQVRGAWFLAQHDYKKRTGRDLQSDLESGSPLILSMVRKQMIGTWEGLKHMTDEQFIAKMQGGEATPPSVMDDPAYTELSAIDRHALAQQALAQAGEERAAQLKAKADANAALQQQMFRDIQAGTVDGRTMEQIGLENDFTYEQMQQLRKAREEFQTASVAIESLGTKLATPGSVFGPEEQKGLDALYAKAGRDRITKLDPEFVSKELFPMVQATGMLPAQLVQDLNNMHTSSNPAQSRYAMNIMSGILAMNKGLFGTVFDNTTQENVLFYQNTAPYLSEEERMAMIARRSSPEGRASQSHLTQQLQLMFSSNPRDFSPVEIAENLGFDGTLDTRTAHALSRDTLALYERNFFLYQDHKQAKAATEQMLGTRWGTTSVGGQTYLMENPPHLAGIAAIGGGYSWLDYSITQDFPELAGKSYRLAADGQTDNEKRQGKPVSYMILEETPNVPGLLLPKFGADNLPVRVAFYEPELQQKLSVDVNLWSRKDQAILPMLDQSAAYGLTNKTALKLAQLLTAADAAIVSETPPIMAPRQTPRYAHVPELDEGEQEALLSQLGYSDLASFVKDMPMLDYSTLIEALERK